MTITPDLVKCCNCGHSAYSINYLTSEPDATCPKCNCIVTVKRTPVKSDKGPGEVSKVTPVKREVSKVTPVKREVSKVTPVKETTRCPSCHVPLSHNAVSYGRCQSCRVPLQPRCGSCGTLLTQAAIEEKRCQTCGLTFKKSNTEVKLAAKKNGIATLCGCQRHMININDEGIVHYKGDWWALKCLFVKVDKRMRKIVDRFDEMKCEIAKMGKEVDAYHKMRLKFTKMKKFMRQLPCRHCGYPVGNRFVQLGDDIFCGACRRHTKEN